MANYKLSKTAKEDLIRIHQFGTYRFGITQADKCFDDFFQYFHKIADNPYSYDSVDYIRIGYRRCPCVSDTIYFRVIGNVVEIMTIIGKQDFK